MRRRIKVQFHEKNESTCYRFHELMQAGSKFHKQKFNTQQVPWAKSVSRGENQLTSLTKRKIKMEQGSGTKKHATNSMSKIWFTRRKTYKKFYEQTSACNKFHEKNPFQEEKNQCDCFNKSKINMKQFSRTKFSTQQVPWTK